MADREIGVHTENYDSLKWFDSFSEELASSSEHAARPLGMVGGCGFSDTVRGGI